jgi:hypothetical protein
LTIHWRVSLSDQWSWSFHVSVIRNYQVSFGNPWSEISLKS